MEAIVKSGQLSWTGSGWPVREEASGYNEETGILELQHAAEDKEAGLRAFMPEVAAVLKCHMDVEASDGRTYVPKFSDAFAQEWLNDQASDFAIARRVLSEYHPLEQEMWLQLASFTFRPCVVGGTMRRFVVPSPWFAQPPDAVQRYCDAEWRDDDMTLLQFLRKSSKEGNIARHIKLRMMEEAEDDETVESFANRCQCRLHTFIAVFTAMRFSDTFYGQWVINVPFRRLSDLNFEGLDRGSSSGLLEGPREGQGGVGTGGVRRAHPGVQPGHGRCPHSCGGRLPQWRAGAGQGRSPDTRRVPAHAALPKELHAEQWRVVDTVLVSVDASVRAAWTEESLSARSGLFAVLGPAGSGKSTAVQVAIQRALSMEARVVVACTTRMLVADWRTKFPELDVDSVHSIFELFKPEQQTLDAMCNLDFIVVEEVSLDHRMFERLLRLWDAARPTMVFVGDFAQLRGVQHTQATDSLRWADVRRLHLRTMRRCKCPELKWKLELLRTAKPDKKQLQKILKSHKAPGPRRGDSGQRTR